MNLSKSLLAGALGLCCLAAPVGVEAQSLDFFRRAPAQTAQSQTTPPGDIPGQGDAEADPGDAAALMLRVNRLEDQLRQATGQIEQLQNQQRRLEDQLKKFREDVEFRLGEHPGAATAAQAPAVEPAPVKPMKKSDAFDPAAAPSAAGAPQALGTTQPSAPVKPPAPASAPLELSLRNPPAPAGAPTVISGSGVALLDGPREQYNAALIEYQNGRYDQAEAQFKAFLAANATHRLAPDAVFFLGETYLQRSRPREAAEQYLRVSTDFSRSTRAPESMVRLGQSLAALGNNEQACATLGEFDRRYPAASTSTKKLAEREKQKDHC